MRRITTFKVLICALPMALLACAANKPPQANLAASPQTQGDNKTWPWPDSMEALVAAPNNHKVILENDRVRVLEVTIKPREKEPVHGHRWPSVLYIDKAGDFRDFDMKGNVLFDSRTAKEPIRYPVTQWMEPQAPHAVENLGDEPIHLVRVELKK